MSRQASPPILFDLSPVVDSDLPVWPGDTPFGFELTARCSAGDSVNLSRVITTPHLGSHADAPFHAGDAGGGIETMPLDAYIGPCRVVAVASAPLIEPEVLAPIDVEEAPRLLFKTSSAQGRDRFPEHFTALSPALARQMASSGVRLVGTDAPSVDPFSSRTLDAHHALLDRGVAVLEGLRLDEVLPGLYELIALPLRLRGLDASPVRAVLRQWQAPTDEP